MIRNKKFRTFWSLIIEPNQIQRIDLLESTELKLTNVCIISKTDSNPKPSNSFLSTAFLPAALTQIYINNNFNASLKIEDQKEDENWKLITTLIPGREEHRHLNFVINSDDTPKFFIQNRPMGGNVGSAVHLVGYLTTYIFQEDILLEEEEEEEEEEKNEKDSQNHDPPPQNQRKIIDLPQFDYQINQFDDALQYNADKDDNEEFHLENPNKIDPFEDFEL